MKRLLTWKSLFFLLINGLLLTPSWAKPLVDVDGATVSTSEEETTLYVCPNDELPDPFIFINTSTSTANYRYVVTNENLEIIGLPPADMVDFDNAGLGICRVWGVSYSGTFTASLGDNAATAVFSDDCFDLSDNFVTVNRSNPDGGNVNTVDDQVVVYTCPGDGIDDFVHLKGTTDANLLYGYVITDPMLTILDITASDSINFENAAPGICWVWGISYTGNLLSSIIGQNVSVAGYSDECYNLSDNFVVVNRDTPLGGAITLENGTTQVDLCVGDGAGDIINFVNIDISNSAYAYLITDASNNILATTTESSFDFSGAGTGICRVWGLAYAGNLIAVPGDNTVSAMLADDCFDLSNDFIEINRTGVNGGAVEAANGETELFLCVGDGMADEVSFNHMTTATGANYRYIVTDESLNIIGLPMGNLVDFENAPAGVCWVWGLSYTGNFQAMLGDNAGTALLSDDCFGLSENFVIINRDTNADGAMVTTMDGANVAYTCPLDGQPDVLSFSNNTSSTLNYVYVITDTDFIILDISTSNMIDFENAGAGTCLVWGLSYGGDLTATIGDNATTVAFADGCYDLSDEFVTVNRANPDGATVSLANGSNEITLCTSDGVADPVNMTTTSVANIKYAYVITDIDHYILNVVESNTIDFEGVPAGVCLVWGLSYTGNITATAGDSLGFVFFTDDCFNVSDNFVTVNRVIPDGGTLSTTDGATTVNLCVDDGLADMVEFTSSSTETNYQYLITDANNSILVLPSGNSNDFEGVPPGVCRVWAVAYNGMLSAMIGDNAATAALADGCFALSSNFIEVNRIALTAGEVSTTDGATMIEICVGDGSADLLAFETNSTDGNYQYVITDSDNVILGLPSGNQNDFEGADVGVCRVWGLSYTGTITAMMGNNAATTALSDECYELSSNFIEVQRDSVGANCVTGTFDLEQISEISLRPNPVSDQLEIQLDRLSAATLRFQVYDLRGRLLMNQEKELTTTNDRHYLDVHHLVSGVYLLSIQNGAFTTTKKFVVE